MQADIHPNYGVTTFRCTCGNVISTRSTLAKDTHIDVCNRCHPYITGQQKTLDTGGRIDKFKKRFGGLTRGK